MNPAETLTSIATTISPYPASFGDSPYLYGAALASVLSISVFSLIVFGWMLRDSWRFRFIDHPKSLAAGFRFMVGLVALAGLVRSAPEVVYMTCFGDPSVSPEFLGRVLIVKRVFDSLALPIVALWMAVLVSIYPFLMLVLRTRASYTIEMDFASVWPRLGRAVLIFLIVVVIAALMAVAKGYGLGG